ncbi:MAG: hypothetical protein ACI8XX_000076, partial [Polaribacter sp.]
MKYLIEVISKNGDWKFVEIDQSGRVNVKVKANDKIKILLDKGMDNYIALKSGDNLEIILENKEALILTGFYSYKNAISVEFTDASGKTLLLSSLNDTLFDLENGSFLVYLQGDQSELITISKDNTALESVVSATSYKDYEVLSQAPDADSGFSTGAIAGIAGGVGLIGLAAAGGGSSSSLVSSTSALTGKFIDSAVGGIDYYIDGVLKGQTAADGSFSYNLGEVITFKVGDITVGSINAGDVNADGIVMPQDLVAGATRADTDNAQVKKIAQFLQTLDSDGDASNGITIDATSKAKVDDSGTKDLSDDAVLITDVIDSNEGTVVATEEAAVAHLNATTNEAAGRAVIAEFSGTINEAMASDSGISSATTT